MIYKIQHFKTTGKSAVESALFHICSNVFIVLIREKQLHCTNIHFAQHDANKKKHQRIYLVKM